MKQVLQSLKNGQTELVNVPAPLVNNETVLIGTTCTLVSAGTERMLVEFGKANLIDKARQQPDKVKMVLEKIKTDGLMPTIETVRNKLDQPVALGYCNVGSVIAVGKDAGNFRIGDRVVSNGNHAEIVRVSKNLCVRIPDNVSNESAVFTVIGAIALQGIRLVQPSLGKAVVVTGLGLIGLMTVQLLRAQGCRVLGIDFDSEKIALAQRFGAECVDLSKCEDPIKVAESFSRGHGVDAVIITASSKSNEPVSQAATMCRKRGRIVLVGVVGLELSRADFFEKELSFQVSCSYGPGRYDTEYEEKGHDYPVGFVRWTVQRNMEAVLDMMAYGALDMGPLISYRFKLDNALKAYELLSNGEHTLGIILEYPGVEGEQPERIVSFNSTSFSVTLPSEGDGVSQPVVGFVGAGNYAGQVLIPAFKKSGARLKTVASSSGVSGVHFGKKHGFEATTTDVNSIFSDDEINTVVVATRHDSHAGFVLDALKAGMNVFVEKPLCLTLDELEEIKEAYAAGAPPSARLAKDESSIEDDRAEGSAPAEVVRPLLMVGFNRRFAPQVQKIKELLDRAPMPKSFIMTVNAGAIPADHWVQDAEVGGGRIIGEACHYIDLLRFLAGSPITNFHTTFMGQRPGMMASDKVSISLSFADGSFGTIHYLANGHKSFPKERLEVFCTERILQLENFRKLRGFGWPGFKKMNLRRQDKGQKACAEAFLDAIREGGMPPISIQEVMEVSRFSIEIAAGQIVFNA